MSIQADDDIDITGEVCPMTFVRTKLRLERMQPGEILAVRLRGDEPLRNVPVPRGTKGMPFWASTRMVISTSSSSGAPDQLRLRRRTKASAFGRP